MLISSHRLPFILAVLSVSVACLHNPAARMSHTPVAAKPGGRAAARAQLGALWIAPAALAALLAARGRDLRLLAALREAAEAELWATLEALPEPLPQQVLEGVERAVDRGRAFARRAGDAR